MLRMLPSGGDQHDVVALWEHSLATALVARKLARRIGVRDPEQVYIAALLHDLGFMVNLRVAPQEFQDILKRAQAERRSMDELEQEVWGCTHCDTGRLLASRWELAPLIVDVIQHHHRVSNTSTFRPTIALVAICDQLCRAHGLGHGHVENLNLDWNGSPSLAALREEWPVARNLDWAQMGAELISYLKEVRKLVSVLFRFQ